MTPECVQLMKWLIEPGTVVYLSGEAGTGKTYQIQQLLAHWPKPSHKDELPTVAVTAPTGLAADHIGGQTIHLFLRIPVKEQGFDLRYLPNGLLQLNPEDFPTGHRQSHESFEERIKALKLLIIDEVSMVRCDLMEIIEARLRMVRENDKPFGGLSLLLVGDLHQLPPVCKKEDREILRQTGHKSPYFFDARVFSRQVVTIRFMELTQVHRVQQGMRKSAELKDMLHNIREGKWTEEAQRITDQRNALIRERFSTETANKFITTHRVRAAIMNQWMLHYLPGPFVRITPICKGEGENYDIKPQTLVIKVGAPVMFTESDTVTIRGGKRRFYKGTFGIITQICNDHLIISIQQADGTLKQEKILRMRWRMNEDHELKRIARPDYKEAKNYVSQYPIELAWAITIHKAQGCSIDKLFVDAQELFESGQLYVALSRATSMAGLHLLNRIIAPPADVDPAVLRFEEAMRNQNVMSHTKPAESNETAIPTETNHD